MTDKQPRGTTPLTDPTSVKFELDKDDDTGEGMTEAEAEKFLSSVPVRNAG